MSDWFILATTFLVVLVLAGVKSLRFAPNDLTGFELQRQVALGNNEAIAEHRLRTELPLLQALQRLVALLLTICIIALLTSNYHFFTAVLFAVGCLLLAEVLDAQPKVQARAAQLYNNYRTTLFAVIDKLRPALKLMADRAAFNERAATFYSKDELKQVIDNDTQALTAEEKLLITQALQYKNISIQDIMTPRSMITYVQADDTIGPLLLDGLHKSGHSRFPVIKKDIDHVVGMLYLHDLVLLDPKTKLVHEAMNQKVYYVQQDKSLDHALHAFLRTKHHLFIVVNEFEETTGVISIEDVLETIIGRKIVDEFDQYEDLRAVARLAAAARVKSSKSQRI